MNAINVIHPYRWHNLWVFDDESRGLDKEPFVAGADKLLTLLTEGADKCSLIFSLEEFPDGEHVLHKIGPGMGGGTDYMYHFKEGLKHRLWLCPALFKYFEDRPDKIYFKLIVNED
jgi:hypothetical protein